MPQINHHLQFIKCSTHKPCRQFAALLQTSAQQWSEIGLTPPWIREDNFEDPFPWCCSLHLEHFYSKFGLWTSTISIMWEFVSGTTCWIGVDWGIHLWLSECWHLGSMAVDRIPASCRNLSSILLFHSGWVQGLIFYHLMGIKSLNWGIPRWWLEEEAESVLPIVKSWRNARDTPCRQGHQEEAKLWPLHTSSLCRESPLYVKRRNQEGP
jgi:hypothetical protein